MQDLINEAREWIADAFSDVDAYELSDAEVQRGIERFYDGGWRGFVRDGGPVECEHDHSPDEPFECGCGQIPGSACAPR